MYRFKRKSPCYSVYVECNWTCENDLIHCCVLWQFDLNGWDYSHWSYRTIHVLYIQREILQFYIPILVMLQYCIKHGACGINCIKQRKLGQNFHWSCHTINVQCYSAKFKETYNSILTWIRGRILLMMCAVFCWQRTRLFVYSLPQQKYRCPVDSLQKMWSLYDHIYRLTNNKMGCMSNLLCYIVCVFI